VSVTLAFRSGTAGSLAFRPHR